MSYVLSESIAAATPADRQEVGEAVRILAKARSECLSAGINPVRLGELMLEEASLAWLVGGLDEQEVRTRLDTLFSQSVRPWLGKLRRRAGVCDCVAEVHFEALCEKARNDRSDSNA